MIEFISNLFNLVVVLIDKICGLLQEGEFTLEVIDLGIVVVTEAGREINPNITRISVVFKGVGNRGVDRIEDPCKNQIFGLIPLSIIWGGRIWWLECAINKRQFIFGIKGTSHCLLPFGEIISIEDTRN